MRGGEARVRYLSGSPARFSRWFTRVSLLVVVAIPGACTSPDTDDDAEGWNDVASRINGRATFLAFRTERTDSVLEGCDLEAEPREGMAECNREGHGARRRPAARWARISDRASAVIATAIETTTRKSAITRVTRARESPA